MNNDLTILISSCDNFSDLWVNNDTLFNKYWKEHPPIYLLSDKDNNLANELKFKFYYYSEEFSDRLLKILSEIKTPYVFLTLDDYLICRDVDNKKINAYVTYMKKHNMSYLRFFKRSKTHYGMLDKKMHIHLLKLERKCYEVNLYPSIWRVDDLKKIIYSKNENIWKFEVRATRRARENNLLCGWINNKGIYDFVDTIRKGKYLRNAYRFLKKKDLYISDRSVRTVKETLGLNIRTFFARYMPSFLVNIGRKLSRKPHYSDYSETDD